MNNIQKVVMVLLTLMVSSNLTYAQMAVLDPTNLIENTISALQEKLANGNLRDMGKIQNSQLKADNQTVAEAIGIDEAVNTNLNLDMAHLKYSITPSAYVKSYLKESQFSIKLSKTKQAYNAAVSHFNTVIASQGAAQVLTSQNFLKAINGRIQEIEKIQNISLLGTGGSVSGGTNTGNQFNNTGGGGGSAQDSLYSAAEANYETTIKNNTELIQQLNEMKTAAADNSEEGWFSKFGGWVKNVVSAGLTDRLEGLKEEDLMEALDNEIKKAQSAISDAAGTFKSSVGSSIFGNFGGTASQQGTGQKVVINAGNGLMNDQERIALAQYLMTEMDVIQDKLKSFSGNNMIQNQAFKNKTEMIKYRTSVTDLYKGLENQKFDSGLIKVQEY